MAAYRTSPVGSLTALTPNSLLTSISTERQSGAGPAAWAIDVRAVGWPSTTFNATATAQLQALEPSARRSVLMAAVSTVRPSPATLPARYACAALPSDLATSTIAAELQSSSAVTTCPATGRTVAHPLEMPTAAKPTSVPTRIEPRANVASAPTLTL